jgi:alpha-amylase
MTAVCLYLQIHQPYRVKRYRAFDIGNDSEYFNDDSETDLNNRRILEKVNRKSYYPTALILKELLDTHPEFKFALSFSGVVLEQLGEYAPETLALFQEMVKGGRVEILSETYYHSLAFFHSVPEFEWQVGLHGDLVYDIFGVIPRIFRNTELAYTNDLALWAESKGYDAVLAEGWDYVLGWRSPNFLYRPPKAERVKLLLKNYKLSDDIAFRFSESAKTDSPMTAETFSNWISAMNGNAETVNLFMDFETFGEHQWEDTGIFEFLKHLPRYLLLHPDNEFMTPSEVVNTFDARDEVDVPHVMTWADTERDLSAWTGNEMQRDSLRTIYELEDAVKKSSDERLVDDWRRLQTSDHFYYMCTKWFADGDVHAYFNPYDSPYEAFIAHANAVKDLKQRLELI